MQLQQSIDAHFVKNRATTSWMKWVAAGYLCFCIFCNESKSWTNTTSNNPQHTSRRNKKITKRINKLFWIQRHTCLGMWLLWHWRSILAMTLRNILFGNAWNCESCCLDLFPVNKLLELLLINEYQWMLLLEGWLLSVIWLPFFLREHLISCFLRRGQSFFGGQAASKQKPLNIWTWN